MTAPERHRLLESARAMSVDELWSAVWFYSDAFDRGCDEDYCEAHGAVFKGKHSMSGEIAKHSPAPSPPQPR